MKYIIMIMGRHRLSGEAWGTFDTEVEAAAYAKADSYFDGFTWVIRPINPVRK